MTEWSLSTSLALAGVTVALLGCLAAVFVRAIAHAMRVTQAQQARHDEVCEGFAELAAANAAMRRQLDEVARRVEQTGRAPVLQQAPASVRAYDLAARLAAGGAASEELVTSCGLTPAEAELAVLVHGARSRAVAVAH
jgi:hypothetical protein